MTIKYYLDHATFKMTANQKKVLFKKFKETDNLLGLIPSSEELVIRALRDTRCEIIHADGSINKKPPENGEAYLGIITFPNGDQSIAVPL